MQDFTAGGTDPEAVRVLEAHLSAMAAAALVVEDVLGSWARKWCQSSVETALAGDAQRTQTLESAATYPQLLNEVAQLTRELPARIADGLQKTAWRHLYVNPRVTGSGRIMADLDYGIWQESGYKIPPAYEPTVSKEFARVTQLLRKYGYRPDFGAYGAKFRHAAPGEGIAPMETYYRLALRLQDLIAAADLGRSKASGGSKGTSWDAT
jgi:hypothetical protein